MTLLLMLFGATVVGGLTLFDFGSENAELEDDHDEYESRNLVTEPVGQAAEESPPRATNPLDIAVEAIPNSIDQPADLIPSSTEEVEHSTLKAITPIGQAIFNGVSNTEMGSTDKSFGIAHRFYENDLESKVLIGGDGNDTIYAGLGSEIIGGDGADRFELFVPQGLYGQEVLDLQDFEAGVDRLVVILELDFFTNNSSNEPQVTLEQSSNSDTVLFVNGVSVAVMGKMDADLPFAISMDGHGEQFCDYHGNPMTDDELEATPIHVKFLEKSVLFGI